MGFRQQLWGNFSKLTELYHITQNEFSKRVPNTVKYGIETIFFSSKKLGFSRRKNERMFLFGSF